MTIFFGWLALGITLIYTCLGLGIQLLNNFRRRSTLGLSPFMLITLLCTFISWTLYGYVSAPRDYFIIIPNIIGGVCTFGMLVQVYLYRNPKTGSISQ